MELFERPPWAAIAAPCQRCLKERNPASCRMWFGASGGPAGASAQRMALADSDFNAQVYDCAILTWTGPKLKFVRFLLAAGASVPFNIASRILFSYVMPFELAVVLAHGVGMLVAYVLTRTFVFQSTRNSRLGELSRFALVNVVSAGLTLVVAAALLRLVFPMVRYNHSPELTAHVVGLAVSSALSFVGHRRFSFRESDVQY